MKSRFTLKRLIIGSIIFLLGLMTLLTLCIPLLKVSDSKIDYLISHSGLDIKTFETGFTLLDFESSAGIDNEMAIISGILALLQLLLSISTMIVAALCIFISNNALAKKLLRGFSISCLIFNVLYMIWGMVFACGLYKYLQIFRDGSWGLYSSSEYGYAYYETSTNTLAYLGFIFSMLLFVAYVVCSVLLKDDMTFIKTSVKKDSVEVNVADADKPKGKQGSPNIAQAKDVAGVLKEYKELLDGGIITQEEFDKKKNELLNN